MITLEQCLAAHPLYYNEGEWKTSPWVCKCKWTPTFDPSDEFFEGLDDDSITGQHAAHVAATWREARTVRTVEQLNIYLAGTTIQELCPTSANHEYFECVKCIYPPKWEMSFQCGWSRVGHQYDDDDCTPSLPVLILWTPEGGAA